MLWVEDPRSKERAYVIPGAYRTKEVEVGLHRPPQAEALDAFMRRFSEAYCKERLSVTQQLISVAAAHHRLLWIHPFLDGNGRIARLMSDSMLMRLGVSNGLWSISRGISMRVDEYKASLEQADARRRGDFDGRGALSLGGLRDFCRFFLKTCIEEVDFMKEILEATAILPRIENYAEDEVRAGRLPKATFPLLREAFVQGEVTREQASELTGHEERRTREVLSALLERGLLRSPTAQGRFTLGCRPCQA